MFIPRSIEELHQQILQTLLQQNTTLTDISPGSALYTLTRSFAGAQAQQELLMLDLARSFYISTAEGRELDLRAADYGLTRKPGAFATGYVLAISQTETIQVDARTILTEPASGLQFQIVASDSLGVSSFSETKIAIRALSQGEDSNLRVGTRLITPAYPEVTFLVGEHRTTAGELCNPLTGGRSPERDEELRSRLTGAILNSRGTTTEAIRISMLAQPTVPWAAIKSPLPGYIQVWVDSASSLPSQELRRLEEVANTFKPAGTVLTVQQATRQLIDVNIFARPSKSLDLQALTDRLIGLTKKYLIDLSLGQNFSRADLTKIILAVPGILDATVITPEEDVVAGEFSVIRGDTIWVTYETL